MLEATLDYWQMEAEDLTPLAKAFSAHTVTVIGDPVSGNPIAFVLTDNVCQSEKLMNQLQAVIATHTSLEAPR